MQKTFWLVWSGGGSPTYRHDDEGRAIAEASRLARLNPGTSFAVLESIAVVKKSDVTIERCDPMGDDIPF